MPVNIILFFILAFGVIIVFKKSHYQIRQSIFTNESQYIVQTLIFESDRIKEIKYSYADWPDIKIIKHKDYIWAKQTIKKLLNQCC